MESYQEAFVFLDGRIKAAEVALTDRQIEMGLSDRTRAYAQLARLRKAKQHLRDAYDLEPVPVDEGSGLDGLSDEYAGGDPR